MCCGFCLWFFSLAMAPLLQARVIGAGPTGSLAALALAEAGWQVLLIDPLPLASLLERQRAYAFTHSSRRLLQRLDLWHELEPRLEPFHRLGLIDAGLNRRLAFSAADLPPPREQEHRSSGPPGSDPVGWIARHSVLMERLLARLARHPNVTLHLGELPPPAAATANELVVAADGPASPTREALGIGCWGWTYRQRCLTAEVDLRGAAPAQAWEVLRPEGPFAVLPLASPRFQLVWSAPAQRCRSLEALDDSAFLDRLAAVLPEGLQPEALHGERRSFPVGLALAHRLSRGTTLLVGESAHRCHPVGGQGLNLCWRDVAVLHRLGLRVAQGRLPLARIGRAYGLRRWPDLLLVLVSTDLMVRLHSNRHPLLLPLRSLALTLMARLPRLRRLVLATMTEGWDRRPGEQARPLRPAATAATLA